jgi:hypothetical protein
MGTAGRHEGRLIGEEGGVQETHHNQTVDVDTAAMCLAFLPA